MDDPELEHMFWDVSFEHSMVVVESHDVLPKILRLFEVSFLVGMILMQQVLRRY
jgi:hypothetical protein